MFIIIPNATLSRYTQRNPMHCRSMHNSQNFPNIKLNSQKSLTSPNSKIFFFFIPALRSTKRFDRIGSRSSKRIFRIIGFKFFFHGTQRDERSTNESRKTSSRSRSYGQTWTFVKDSIKGTSASSRVSRKKKKKGSSNRIFFFAKFLMHRC